MRARAAAESASGRDIGDLPAVVDPLRKARARRGVLTFIETYLLNMFTVKGEHWPWAQYHRDLAAQIDSAVHHGTKGAVAVPRGGSKTSEIKAGALYAMMYGFRRWACVLGATAPKGVAIIQDLQTIIETNPLLLEDFPEVCFPVKALARIVNRQRGQTYLGRPTRMTWNSDEIVFPDIPGSACAGAIITSSGLDGAGIRGQVRVMPDGTQLRPDLVFIDDPQTDESAKSEFQTADRASLLSGAVLQMGPPGVPLAALMACTVIREGDVADKTLNDPEWNGIRVPMLIKFPLHMSSTPENIPHSDHWDRYGSLLLAGRKVEATAFYAAHRALPECLHILDQPRPCAECPIRGECMDAEAMVSWQHRKFPNDLSPIQHAMDQHIKTPDLFAAEMQQRPISSSIGGVKITPVELARRGSGLKMGVAPTASSFITAGVDVHDLILYWTCAAWESDFTGQILQYGTYPEQSSRWFRQASPPRTLAHEFPGLSKDALIQAGLNRLMEVMLKMEYERAGGGAMPIDLIFVDEGYKPGIVNNVRRMIASPVMKASRGLPLRATNKPISAYNKKPGWKFGDNWYIPSITGTREYPHVCIDTNYWKTFLHRSLATAPGTRGALMLFGNEATKGDHEMYAEHVAGSEYFNEVFANGRIVCEYKVMPGKPDNHWFDTTVMCTVAASMMGCKPPEIRSGAERKAKPVLRNLAQMGAKQ